MLGGIVGKCKNMMPGSEAIAFETCAQGRGEDVLFPYCSKWLNIFRYLQPFVS